MKTRAIILSVVLVFLVPVASNAQVGKLLKNKVGKVVNAGVKEFDKEVGKEIDTAAQKEVQSIGTKANEDMEQSQEGGDQQSAGINLGGLMGGKVTSKYNESYSFKSRIYMQMEIYDKKEVTKMDYFMYFSDAEPTAGFESKIIATSDDGDKVTVASSFVFDGLNKSFLIMTDMGSMKIGIISQVPDETAAQNQLADNMSKASITKTGNSRVIAGYKCDEYLYMDNETKENGKIWLTKDLRLGADKRTLSKAGLPSYYGHPELQDGVIMAMESYNGKNELEMKSETREVNLNFPHTISTAGFSFRQMNFDQAQGGQKK